ncbi:right-handed parallel beta-helix repeat-containing protein [Candidatus Sumerlaeota bacterium]|nr:right-handed parallel beta-helix repeat-containing protein [Candidatus Sumerlaeota bacterium]
MSIDATRGSLLITLLLITSPLLAGDLNPPGAPAPTPGPEPRIAINDANTPGTADSVHVITDQGSYYLEDDITIGSAAKNGIVIEASNVTLDLNGFRVDGRELIPLPWVGRDLEISLDGILASGEVENITIRNGTVRDWGHDGIDLWGATGVRLVDLTVMNGGIDGITAGEACVVSQCVAEGNDGTGIRVGGRGVITGCVSQGNEGEGFVVGSSNITACTATENGGSGINAAWGSLVADCILVDNGGDGIFLSSEGNQALRNTCYANGYPDSDGAGIEAQGHNRIEGNHVRFNDQGIRVSGGSGCLIVRNSATENVVNYDITGSHGVGPIVSGTAPITTTSPWANFEF